MAKKKRRPNIPQATLEQVRRQVQAQGAHTKQQASSAAGNTPPRKAVAVRPTASTTTVEDLRAQYAYVITDLTNMAILSGAFLLGLVVLSLFI